MRKNDSQIVTEEWSERSENMEYGGMRNYKLEKWNKG